MPAIKERVETLEEVMKECARNINLLSISQTQTERELRDFKGEMQGFKDEMKDFKDEMQDFKDEMKVFKSEMQDFKSEMKEFKDKMLRFSEDSKEDRIRWYKQWGDLTNKLGSIVEDMVAPNIPGIARTYFGCEDLDFFGLRITKRNLRDKSKSREFDIIAMTGGMFIINETKATPRGEYIQEFVETLKEVPDYFPESLEKTIIPVFSSLYLPQNVITYLTRMKIYAMAIKDDTMDLLNYRSICAG